MISFCSKMFLDSIIGLPSQIISTVGNTFQSILSIPGQVSGNIKDTIVPVAQTAGQTLSSITSSATDLFSSPLLIVGAAVVLILILKK